MLDHDAERVKQFASPHLKSFGRPFISDASDATPPSNTDHIQLC